WTDRGRQLSDGQRAVLARALWHRRAAGRCGRLHALSRLQPAGGRLDSQPAWRAREPGSRRLPEALQYGSVCALSRDNDHRRRIDLLADGEPAGRPWWTGLRLQMEHGMD